MDDLEQRLIALGDCSRPEGCVCGGDTPAVRSTCGYYDSNPIGREAATTLAAKDAEIARLRQALKQAERGFNACNVLVENLTGAPSTMIETFEERTRATGADDHGG